MESLQVTLADCEKLIKSKIVCTPGGVTKCGHPLLAFPDNYKWYEVLETELLLLLKYLCNVATPKAEQVNIFSQYSSHIISSSYTLD